MTERPLDVPKSEITTVIFASSLLEFIMTTAGTTDVKAGKNHRGEFQIKVGPANFAADDADEAFRLMLKWLLKLKPKMQPAEYARNAEAVLHKEKEDADEAITELTKDGMSEFGKKLTASRQEREQAVLEAVVEIGVLPNASVEDWQMAVGLKVGFTPDQHEVLEALKYRGIKY